MIGAPAARPGENERSLGARWAGVGPRAGVSLFTGVRRLQLAFGRSRDPMY